MEATIKTSPAAEVQDFHVVGIGASAGGLDAFKAFLSTLPINPGMAFVFVQHLLPNHESTLPEILSRHTELPVYEVTDEIHLAVNNIYVIPENKVLKAYDGVLKLEPRLKDSRTNLPIDTFLTTLAEVHQTFAIGIILSGAGFDGTKGLKAIKEFGGATLAQDSHSAAFDSMPHNAAKSEVVDYILTPEEMPAKLEEIKIAYNKTHAHTENESTIPKREDDEFRQILKILKKRTGNDFLHYKQATLRRRIARRMVITRKEETSSYLAHLRNDIIEQDALFNDVLIPVSYFFRDPKVFDVLKQDVLSNLFKGKAAGDKVRIWSAGCSTGEEAYSIAMIISEYLTEHRLDFRVQIFASDISEHVISKARAGIYSKQDLGDVSEERINHFFNKIDGDYHISRRIREMCVFAVHNFTKDPPFAKLDLISCRNVLIYLDPYLQNKTLATFHYALRDKGVLMLGKSESASNRSNLFTHLVKNEKIYLRMAVAGSFTPSTIGRITAPTEERISDFKFVPHPPDFQKIAFDILFNKYTPAGVIVNENREIVHFHGDTSPFLLASPGKPNFNLLKMAREGLGFELQSAILNAKAGSEKVIRQQILVKNGKSDLFVDVEVMPIEGEDFYYLILFFNKTVEISDRITESNDSDAHRIKQLEAELRMLRGDIQTVSEEQEAYIEELQSANEELLSSSEELQTLNEELETSAEELQSNNEELISVNDELMDRQDQLYSARLYAEAIVSTIREPLIILDQNLRVKSANDAYYNYFHTNEKETEGKFFFQIAQGQWDKTELKKLLYDVLPKHQIFEGHEMTASFPVIGDRTLILNARQIINEKYNDPLILLVIEDVTRSRVYGLLQESEQRFRQMADSAPVMLWQVDTNGDAEFFNKSWLNFTGRTLDDELKDGWKEGIHPDDNENFLKVFDDAFQNHIEYSYEYRLKRHDGVYRWIADKGVPRFTADHQLLGFIGGAVDIQVQRDFTSALELNVEERTQELRQSQAFLTSILNSTHYGIASYQPILDESDNITDFRIVYTNPEVPANFNMTIEDVLGKTCKEVYPGIFENGVFEKLVKCFNTGDLIKYDVSIDQEGTERWLTASAQKVNNSLTVTSKDITKEKNAALHLQELNKLLSNKNRELEHQILHEFIESFSSYKTGKEYFDFLLQEIWQKTKMDFVVMGELVNGDNGGRINSFAVNESGHVASGLNYALKGSPCESVVRGNPKIITSNVKNDFKTNRIFTDLNVEGYVGVPLFDLERHCIGILSVMNQSEIRNPQYIESLLKIAAKRAEIELQRQQNERMLEDKNLELQRSNKELESFNYIASHDLQEPLRKIQLFYSRILHRDKDKLSEPSLEYFESISNAADRMQKLIVALLSYSTASYTNLEFEKTDLNVILNDVLTDFVDVIEAKKVTIKADPLPKINVVPFQFRQLLANLISNGIKYSKKDEPPIITITSETITHPDKKGRKLLKLSVADNGIGFEQQYEHKIFELFQRLHGKTEFAGTGIGLAICKKIVNNHKGSIEVTSELGVGSVFTVLIPM